MAWQNMPYFIVQAVASGMAALLALYAWRRRAVAGGVTFALLMLAVSEWAFTNAMEAISIEMPAKILWSKISYLGITSVAPLWLVFSLIYSQRDTWLTRRARRAALLWIVPAIITGLTATNEWHGLTWPTITASSDEPGAMAIYAHGVCVWLNVAYSYTLLLIGTFWIVRTALRSAQLYRYQVWLLLAGAAVPWIGNVLYMIDLIPLPGLDLTPIAFTVTGIMITLSIFRFQMLDIVPVARDAVLESMSDGVLVLDARHRIVDINPAAQRLVKRGEANLVGQPVDVALAAWTDLVERYRNMPEAQAEIVLGEAQSTQWIDMRISPLRDRRGQLTGRLIVLRDITARKQAEATIEQRNRELAAAREAEQAALRREMNRARDIQTSLLPRAAPSLAGLDIAACSLPAREVGGDWYNYYELPGNEQNPHVSYGLAVGDVTGKGIPAALYMAVSTVMLTAKAPSIPDVARLMDEMNTALYPYMAPHQMNTALCYARLEPMPERQAGYVAHTANAGLVAPILRRGAQCEYLDIGGLPLGAELTDIPYTAVSVPLQAGDSLVLSSDGIVEATNETGEMYGFERFLASVANAPRGSARDIQEWILAGVRGFVGSAEPHDDMTLIVIVVKS